MRDSGNAGTAGRSGTPPDSGLPRSRRLTASRRFQEVFEKGRSQAGPYVVLWVCPAEGAGPRLGVVASRRALRRAVDRNRAKRLLREAFRLNRSRFRTGVDVVLVARSRIAGVRRQDVERDLLALAGKMGLLRD